MSGFMVGRQPIFDSELAVRGYELLFRGSGPTSPGGDAMTAEVLVRAGLDLGLQSLVGSKLAFVNATRPFLVGDQVVPLPPEQTVIEIVEGLPCDSEAVAGCRRLVAQGYALALDDRAWAGNDLPGPGDPLLELVSLVKLDVLALPPARLEAMVRRCAELGVQVVAEKVETAEQLEYCRDLGFELFQGNLLSRPEVVEGQTLSPSRVACLRVISELCEPCADADDIQRAVEADAGLSYRFLRLAGEGASRGLYRRVRSVREGVVLLGRDRVRAWIMLMLLTGSSSAPTEQLYIAMTRARMSGLVATGLVPRLADSAFTVGLVSALDLLLEAPLGRIVESLSLADELVDALINRDGLLGQILTDVLTWELGGGDLCLSSGLSLATLESNYLKALAWATDMCSVLESDQLSTV
jgi:EAL and modified HD-GYP domain-containing signal transduction protein